MNKIVIICPIHNRFPEIIPSMINQTHENWHLLLVHDGPNFTNLRKLIETINDNRITYIETDKSEGLWGHPIRRWILRDLDKFSPDTDYVLVSNDDNYHGKIYFQEMLKGFTDDSIKATYCSHFVHSYLSPQPEGDYEYGVMNTKLELGYIDCACVIIRKDIAIESGWEDVSHSSDWTYFKRIIDKYGEESFKKVLGCLVVHA